MTLRLRLVIALGLLLTAGLGLFGVATAVLYQHSEYQRLDTQLRAAEPLVERQLNQAATQSSPEPFGGGGPPPGGQANGGQGNGGEGGGGLGNGPPTFVPPFAELVSVSGKVLSHIELSTGSAEPKLPTTLPRATGGRLITVGATAGSGHFRVLIMTHPDGDAVVVAEPTTEVTNAVRGLVLIESLGALALLGVLLAGSWFVLRRGLRPLERMASTAEAISAGDLSHRVTPDGGSGEVAQLGHAFNTMLDDIEAAFKQREETEQRLRQFLADASHELRTPLTSIQGFAELFRVSGDDASVDLPTILRRIEQESSRMKMLVEDLLLLARLDQTRVASREPTDLAVLAADACTDAVATAPDRQVTLHSPNPVVVFGDQAHLRQAITNLVANAVRHTPPGSPIDVSARLVEGWAEVEIRDHGAGLDDEAKLHAFDRFWQADRARAGAGSGLGLAIVAGIAAEHGGAVTADNADGGGAAFVLHLPLVAPAPEVGADS